LLIGLGAGISIGYFKKYILHKSMAAEEDTTLAWPQSSPVLNRDCVEEFSNKKLDD